MGINFWLSIFFHVNVSHDFQKSGLYIAQDTMRKSFFDNFTTKHLIGAYRWYRAYFPEDILSTFAASIDIFSFIELDIQLS